MARSTHSWFSVLGVLGATFSLMALAIGDDVRLTAATPTATSVALAPVAAESPYVMPTVVVVADPVALAQADALAQAEHEALTAALLPVPIREAQAQLQKATVATRRAARVSIRVPYYAFGPDPVGGSR